MAADLFDRYIAASSQSSSFNLRKYHARGNWKAVQKALLPDTPKNHAVIRVLCSATAIRADSGALRDADWSVITTIAYANEDAGMHAQLIWASHGIGAVRYAVRRLLLQGKRREVQTTSILCAGMPNERGIEVTFNISIVPECRIPKRAAHANGSNGSAANARKPSAIS